MQEWFSLLLAVALMLLSCHLQPLRQSTLIDVCVCVCKCFHLGLIACETFLQHHKLLKVTAMYYNKVGLCVSVYPVQSVSYTSWELRSIRTHIFFWHVFLLLININTSFFFFCLVIKNVSLTSVLSVCLSLIDSTLPSFLIICNCYSFFIPCFSPFLYLPSSILLPHSSKINHFFRFVIQSTASSAEDDKSQLSMRSQTPLGKGGEGSEFDGQVVWTKAPPLPTPEEKMRQTAKAVPTDIVPINVTGMTLATAIVWPFCPFLNHLWVATNTHQCK